MLISILMVAASPVAVCQAEQREVASYSDRYQRHALRARHGGYLSRDEQLAFARTLNYLEQKHLRGLNATSESNCDQALSLAKQNLVSAVIGPFEDLRKARMNGRFLSGSASPTVAISSIYQKSPSL